jgi:hypothetical protein
MLPGTSHQLHIGCGPVSSAVLQAAGADQEQFAISNAQDAAARRLMRNAAVQLMDGFANACTATDVAVRWQLLCDDGGDGSEAPQLAASAGGLQLQSDERGRAFFGDLAVEEGSGRMVGAEQWRARACTGSKCMLHGAEHNHSTQPRLCAVSRVSQGADNAGLGLQCTLELQVLLPLPKARRSSTLSANNWVTVWERPVLFSDDAARIREVQVGTGRVLSHGVPACVLTTRLRFTITCSSPAPAPAPRSCKSGASSCSSSWPPSRRAWQRWPSA